MGERTKRVGMWLWDESRYFEAEGMSEGVVPVARASYNMGRKMIGNAGTLGRNTTR